MNSIGVWIRKGLCAMRLFCFSFSFLRYGKVGNALGGIRMVSGKMALFSSSLWLGSKLCVRTRIPKREEKNENGRVLTKEYAFTDSTFFFFR